jgi:hypothetical protein
MRTFFLICLLLFALTCSARTHRSAKVRRDFQRISPCPSTGQRSGTCPGYIKDHIKPLCAGGPDAISNMQWQSVAAAKVKDRWERQICAAVTPAKP